MTSKSCILYSLLVLLSAAGAMTLTSCSKDDDVAESNVVSIEMEPDNDLPVDIDGISVDFKILNTDSVAMKTFKEFEDFFFVLSFTNTGNQTVDFPRVIDLVEEDMFRVYTSDNIYVGRPWDTTYITVFLPYIHPQSTKVIWCSWYTYSGYDDKPLRIPGYELLKLSQRFPLPKGSYYTEFEITIHDGKKVKFRKEFKII